MILVFTGSCKNIYEELSDNETVEATLYQARLFLSDGQWTAAIEEFEKLPLATLSVESVAVEYASAYSGRCGLDFFTLAQALQDLGTTRPLMMLLDLIQTTSVANYDDCKSAEDILKVVASPAGVLDSERGKYLMVFNSMAKISVILNRYADTDKNAAVDAGWDPCDGNGATDLPVADVNEVGTGLTLLLANANGISIIPSSFTDLQAACGLLPAPVNFCSIVTASGFTDLHRQGIRGVIRESADGIGLGVVGGGVAASACEP